MIAGSEDGKSVVIEREFAHAPEKLWRALTQPHLVAEWLMTNDIAPVLGHRFSLTGSWGGVIACEIIRCDPAHVLAYTWTHASEDPALDLKSTVTFTLTPTRTGTMLRVEQSGFRPEQKRAFGGAAAGWRQFLGRLDQLLARTA